MKKAFALLAIIGMTAIATTALAQAGGTDYFKSTVFHSPLVPPSDTASTAPVTQTFTLPGYWDLFVVQSTFTKISGTVAGTVGLYGSTDNNGFSLVDSLRFIPNIATKTHTWQLQPSIYRYYKLVVTPTGTMSVKLVSPALWRRKPVR